MKANKTYTLITLIILAIALSACGSQAPSYSAPEPAQARPTARPTEPPIEADCVTPSMLKGVIQEFYGITPRFAFDPDIDNWDKSYTKEAAFNVVIFSYNENNGCVTGLGVTTVTDWQHGDFELTGAYLGLTGLLTTADSDWATELMTQCGEYDQFETRSIPGGEEKFGCEDWGDVIVVGNAIHLY